MGLVIPVGLTALFGGGFDGLKVHLPGLFVFYPTGKTVRFIAPPRLFCGKLFHPHGAGFAVVFIALRIGVLVVPDGFGRLALGKEQQVGFDAGLGVKNAIGQSDNGVQVALGQQLFLQAGFGAFAKQKAIGQYHRCTAIVFQ